MDVYYNKLLLLFDKEFVDEFMHVADIYCKPNRGPIFSTSYYLYYITIVLTDLRRWSSLSLLLQSNKKNHYKTIQDKHLEWSKLNLYEKTYKNINEKYHSLSHKCSQNIVLFIDSSNIYNKCGTVNIGYGQNPKKQESRISLICDEYKNVYSVILIKPTYKTATKRTFCHDSKTIIPNLNDLIKTKITCKRVQLAGDKGYILNKKDKKQLETDYNVQIIHPHRRNQIIKTPKQSKKILKKRYVIENVFASIKIYDRICVRKDKLEETFISFVYLALMLKFKK